MLACKICGVYQPFQGLTDESCLNKTNKDCIFDTPPISFVALHNLRFRTLSGMGNDGSVAQLAFQSLRELRAWTDRLSELEQRQRLMCRLLDALRVLESKQPTEAIVRTQLQGFLQLWGIKELDDSGKKRRPRNCTSACWLRCLLRGPSCDPEADPKNNRNQH